MENMKKEMVMSNEPNVYKTTDHTGEAIPRSTMAMISLVAGILGLTFMPIIGSIVAIITGAMAKNEIEQDAGQLGGEEYARVGITLGWIGLGLAVIGVCVVGVFLAIPLCAGLAIWSDAQWGSLIPTILIWF
jgi:hypothetical protein